MDLEPNETEALVQRTARDYAERVIRPVAADLDRDKDIPREILRGLAELGLMGVNVPAALGGAEAGVVAYALAMMEIARACASTAVTMSVTNMVAEVIARFGTEAQREKHVPKICAGEYAAGSFALSEPEAGSDPGSMRTVAERTEDGWVLRGQKQWITNGAWAGVFVVWARTGGTGTRGLSAFLVEGGTPGLRCGRPEDKLGLRASNTVPLELDDCKVPADALLGSEGEGFKIAMMALDGGRIGIASQAVGIATAALEEATAYARERKQFGRSIGDYEAIQWSLADCRTELEAARALTLRAAWLKEKGRTFSAEAAMAKLYASEAANRICQRALQIHGGYGYVRDFAVERHLRDARVTTIYEGTSEIQRIVIARSATR
ncbi:acyl-CoA dehydrogenase family protein [Polyangium jinanense]|uniref:Cyclohex-1-ene-1-carbonyl-CoA dehydrogenase n=1 Tax=Polyangium jinanense TaxID=2829994 RepID=A0A9X4AWR4_9BACT|nr:acyl-CoA dehydrogenase family protein [Polyangium jinanense]MDC3959191.1 acyl-CoA dehydrogenase family protein [Polyangium jinanense]MDC3987589.1 acyl-CoA dehydrogenase family protein [Polyangium jinanense]